ncbi:MAG: hypothetical protein K2O10_06030, partial [Muribaculaceae bacterium]|nr:hypothetical protein [Muribaculaceae bacterium]
YTEIPDHIAGEWSDLLRIDFSDYKDYAGIGTVAADSADAPAEYFTIDGRRVAAPDHGLYIVRRGSSVSKIMVR